MYIEGCRCGPCKTKASQHENCFRFAVGILINATTCRSVELLGPCFETGRKVVSVRKEIDKAWYTTKVELTQRSFHVPACPWKNPERHSVRLRCANIQKWTFNQEQACILFVCIEEETLKKRESSRVEERQRCKKRRRRQNLRLDQTA